MPPDNPFNLDRRNAVITGGGGRIGGAIAHRLAGAGSYRRAGRHQREQPDFDHRKHHQSRRSFALGRRGRIQPGGRQRGCERSPDQGPPGRHSRQQCGPGIPHVPRGCQLRRMVRHFSAQLDGLFPHGPGRGPAHDRAGHPGGDRDDQLDVLVGGDGAREFCLQHLQGRGQPAGTRAGARMGLFRYPRQRHRTLPGGQRRQWTSC